MDLQLLWWGVLDTTLCDKVCQWILTGQWFSTGTPVSSTNNTDHHVITEILLKVALNTITLTPLKILENSWFFWCEVQEELEDTKRAIRICISKKKNRQHNGQKKKVQKDKQPSTKHANCNYNSICWLWCEVQPLQTRHLLTLCGTNHISNWTYWM
jgi:hypothetical protein